VAAGVLYAQDAAVPYTVVACHAVYQYTSVLTQLRFDMFAQQQQMHNVSCAV